MLIGKMKKKWINPLVGTMLLVGILSACGANTTNTASTASPTSSASQDNTASKSYQQFESAAKAASGATPTQFQGPTTPAKAPNNIKIAIISCAAALQGCQSPVVGAQHAAEALGWTVQTYDGGANAQQQNKNMLNAISWGANIILNVAIDPNLVQQGLKSAKDKGVIVGSGSNGIDTPNPVVAAADGNLGYAFDVSPNYIDLGKGLADWFIVQTKGAGNLAFFSDPEFPSVKAIESGFTTEAKNSSVKVSDPIDFTASQIGTSLGQQTVGYLKSHPDVNWVWSAEDPAAAAQVTAIRQAGLAKSVQLMSQVGAQQNIDFIRTGNVQAADAAYDNEYMGWAMVDQSIRLLNKAPLSTPHGENLPYIILDKSNLPSPGSDWIASFDYKSEYLKLWK